MDLSTYLEIEKCLMATNITNCYINDHGLVTLDHFVSK